MFSKIENLFVDTFLALHAFFKQVNRVLSQLKIYPTFSQCSFSLPLMISDVFSAWRKGTFIQNHDFFCQQDISQTKCLHTIYTLQVIWCCSHQFTIYCYYLYYYIVCMYISILLKSLCIYLIEHSSY